MLLVEIHPHIYYNEKMQYVELSALCKLNF